MAAASAAVGAAYSLNSLYEHYKDYSLAKAETGTTLDKAQAISQDEPSMMWLAFDLLDLGLNVVGAIAAFKALRGAMAAAEKGGVKGLKGLIEATERAGLGVGGKSRVVATTIERMGGPRAIDDMLVNAEAAVKPTLGSLNDPVAQAKIIEDWFLKGSAGK